MTAPRIGLVRLSWSARESFSTDVPERRLTALGDLDPIRRPDGSLDLDALTDTVHESGLDSLLADLEIPENSDGVQDRDVAEAYRLAPAETPAPARRPATAAGQLVQDITAGVRRDDAGRPFADIVLTLATGEQITVTVHESLTFGHTVNVEIDGDLTADNPSLRIHLNDNLIHDSTRNDPAVADPGRPGPLDAPDAPATAPA